MNQFYQKILSFSNLSKFKSIFLFILVLSILITIFYLDPSNIYYILNVLYSFLVTLFILDRFKLSDNKLIRYFQILFFSLFIIYIIIKLFNNQTISNTIYCDSTDNTLNHTPNNSRPSTPNPDKDNSG
jgi:hypothetical protein